MWSGPAAAVAPGNWVDARAGCGDAALVQAAGCRIVEALEPDVLCLLDLALQLASREVENVRPEGASPDA
jgi:hypothetical protein